MKRVAVYQDDEIIAYLYWDGKKVVRDGGPEGLDFILKRPVWVGDRRYDPSEGEEFLSILFRAYAGSRFRCGRLEMCELG